MRVCDQIFCNRVFTIIFIRPRFVDLLESLLSRVALAAKVVADSGLELLSEWTGLIACCRLFSALPRALYKVCDQGLCLLFLFVFVSIVTSIYGISLLVGVYSLFTSSLTVKAPIRFSHSQ